MAGIVAKQYCDAIFALAQENNKLDTYKEQLTLVDETLLDDEFHLVMCHPKINREEKKAMLDTIYGETLDHTLLNFLKLLVDKGRFVKLHDIVKEFIKNYNNVMGIQVVYVTSATALQVQEVTRLKATLETKLQKKIDMRIAVDRDLLAGIRIKIDDQVIDNSAKSQLQRLRKHVTLSDIK